MKLSKFTAVLGALATLAASAANAVPPSSIVSTTGLTIVSPAPTTVGRRFILNSNGALPSQLVFVEKQNQYLTQPLVTDSATIPAYTWVNSVFFALESATPVGKQTTSITFNGPILGVVFESGSANYAGTDFLGAVGTTYSEGARDCHCGFDQGDGYFINGNTITFTNHYKIAGDFARIITQANVCTDRGGGRHHQPSPQCCGASNRGSNKLSNVC